MNEQPENPAQEEKIIEIKPNQKKEKKKLVFISKIYNCNPDSNNKGLLLSLRRVESGVNLKRAIQRESHERE